MRNVVLLTIDALRMDVLRCYGGENDLTPFIDSIQDKCIRFTKAHSTGPYTQAAMPGILTSSYYLEYGRQKKLPDQRTLISQPLKKANIITAAFHSNPHVSGFFGWNRDWDVFYDSMEEELDDKSPYIKATYLNRKVDAWLSSNNQDLVSNSIFIWLHYMDVHEPYVPALKYIEQVDPTIKMTEDEMFDIFKKVLLERDISNVGNIELLKKLYMAHVREIDDAVKNLFSILEKHEILQDSAVVITADHGEEFNEHGGLSHDGKMYSELVRVPLLIYEPDRKQNLICDSLVSSLDISPTILNLFGLNPEPNFEGISLLPLEAYPEKGVFGEAMDKHGSREKGDEKEVHYFRKGDLKIIYRETTDRWELYDCKSDPQEKNNIIEQSIEAGVMKNIIIPRINRFQNKDVSIEVSGTESDKVIEDTVYGILDKEISEKRKRQCARLIEVSKNIIRQTFDRFKLDEVAITWTGGKDSGLCLWIIKHVCEERNISIPKTLIIGEGDEFQEIEDFTEKIKGDWKIPLQMCRNEDVLKAANHSLGATVKVYELNERNRMEIEKIEFDGKEFPFEAESFVGNHLMKTVVFNQFLEDNNVKAIFQGLRWDEHPVRFQDEYFEEITEDHLIPHHTRIRPILHFTEKDLWDTYAAFKIPYCPLYERGYRSLGAKSSTEKKSDIPAWEQDLENTEERSGRQQDKEKAMERLRQLGYM
jgi:phosphoadenosine phosphosulfate reductase